MIQTNEKNYKLLLIKQLNYIKGGWINGDSNKKNVKNKTADIVNHSLKFAMEIKDDTKSSENSCDLKLMNQRYADRVKSASNKFSIYSGYKTLLIIRTEFPIPDIIYYAILGLDTYNKNINNQLVYFGKVGKYSDYIYKQIGGFLIYSYPIDCVAQYYYYPNPHALNCRKTDKEEISRFFKII
ncbi:MAG: hypothetical protein A2430_01550 [Candidatus Liptonbacteria bacterium RIFOXYC1_FULL_36_8]|uniref:Uncharacterized protein n=3 Tax=Candidatus Liptoniibacteriota TaxID=1817909 RepID=A0A1G2CQ26_9BACT|nr:MAG: hypothetical protein A2604_00125 [Candidatus Liptonbacteria bacterium RIFOXYD1_FULL_36_11]OGZ03449.1 MAG: hypothetical protein A2390_00780 [Candidatus Liptonbacteria bacterium RIFOXYB1_FULL_36_10]OGZ04225.1 MAG: hypothetical protein A2430_01550 [Candidatus Liptonbacteria bacterium RIFOXYC1_FULL_36_8]